MLILCNVGITAIYVGVGESIVSIQKAIEIAKPNDTIILRKGIFIENNIQICKPITLIGENEAVIDCNNANANGIFVTSNDVFIKNLIIRNIGISYVSDNSAIKFQKAYNCKVSDIIVENGFFGIYLAKSKNLSITNCRLIATRRIESNSGNGIHLWYCSNVFIAGNQVINHRDGIYFEFVKNALIQNNLCKNNLRYGLHFMFSDSCSYVGNVFSMNGAGVAVMYTKYVFMNKNHFEHNWGQSSYGLLLKDIRDSYVGYNNFYQNTIGVYLEGSNRILFEHNNFIQNGWAVRITANCEQNTFRKNNFISNTFEVITNSVQNFNYFYMNYWSGYSGYDLNKDGIGDVPHVPVTLFSIIAESNVLSLVLLRSFFVDILETAEKIFPSIVPKLIVDKYPLIRIIQ